MKKTIFISSIITSLVLLINILQILITDLEILTDYGYGYLLGKIILFFVFSTIAIVTRNYIVKSKNTR